MKYTLFSNHCTLIIFFTIDATNAPGMGRLINDSPLRFANGTVKKIVHNGTSF